MSAIKLLTLRLLWTSAHLTLRALGKPMSDRKAWTAACWRDIHDITVALGCPPAPQTAPWLAHPMDGRRR